MKTWNGPSAWMIVRAVRQALGHWTVTTVCQGHVQSGTIDELATDGLLTSRA